MKSQHFGDSVLPGTILNKIRKNLSAFSLEGSSAVHTAREASVLQGRLQVHEDPKLRRF
jgi:hypothetical protein